MWLPTASGASTEYRWNKARPFSLFVLYPEDDTTIMVQRTLKSYDRPRAHRSPIRAIFGRRKPAVKAKPAKTGGKSAYHRCLSRSMKGIKGRAGARHQIFRLAVSMCRLDPVVKKDSFRRAVNRLRN